MFFGQLFKKFGRHSGKRSNEKRTAINQVKANNNLSTKNQLNKALNRVNNTIQAEGHSNQLLLQKADILLRKGEIKQSRQILNKISETKNNSNEVHEANRLLTELDQLQQKLAASESDQLIETLRKCAHIYNEQLVNLPQTKPQTLDLEIIQLVRREARRARSRDLPKLSLELLEQTLQAGNESPWLNHDIALSLYMMGQTDQALKILNELAAKNKGAKISNSISKNIQEIESKPNLYKSKINSHLAKQAALIAKSKCLNTQYIPKHANTSPKGKVKPLIFKEARSILKNNPESTLLLINLILSYFPGDLASLQLKGEALASLKEIDKAITIWKGLSRSENAKIATKASELIALTLATKAQSISTKKSPKAAILFYIQKNLECNLPPTLNKDIENILSRIKQSGNDFSDPNLLKHQFQLQLDTLAIEHIEALRSNKGRLEGSASAQMPGAIRKTAPKAG